MNTTTKNYQPLLYEVVNFGGTELQIIRRIYDRNQSVKSVAISEHQCSEAGQSLVEVLLTISIFIIGVITVGTLIIDANVSSRQGVERTQAITLAREGLEAARSLRDADFDNLTTGAHGLALSNSKWIFSGTSDAQNQFTRVVTVTDIDIDTKKIDSTVTWQFSTARQNSVTLIDYLTDWNQTQGDAGNMRIDITGTALGNSNRELQGVKIENLGTASITIDKMAVFWDTAPLIQEVKINGVVDWSGAQSSGALLDITNVILTASSGLLPIDRLFFDASMTGTHFVVKFIMTDTSTKYVIVNP